jgi:hypothetical protein
VVAAYRPVLAGGRDKGADMGTWYLSSQRDFVNFLVEKIFEDDFLITF